MAARFAVGVAVLCALNGCAGVALESASGPAGGVVEASPFPVLGERVASLYDDRVMIPVHVLAPTTSFSLEAPQGVEVRGVRITFADGSAMVVDAALGRRVEVPGPPRRLRQLEVTYASHAPPDTYATIRVHDMTASARPLATAPIAQR